MIGSGEAACRRRRHWPLTEEQVLEFVRLAVDSADWPRQAAWLGSVLDSGLDSYSPPAGAGGWVYDPVQPELFASIAAVLERGSERALRVALRLRRWLMWHDVAVERERAVCEAMGLPWPPPVEVRLTRHARNIDYDAPGAIFDRQAGSQAAMENPEHPSVGAPISVAMGFHRARVRLIDGVPDVDPEAGVASGRPWVWPWEWLDPPSWRQSTVRRPWGMPLAYPADFDELGLEDRYGWASERAEGEVLVVDAAHVRDVWWSHRPAEHPRRALPPAEDELERGGGRGAARGVAVDDDDEDDDEPPVKSDSIVVDRHHPPPGITWRPLSMGSWWR